MYSALKPHFLGEEQRRRNRSRACLSRAVLSPVAQRAATFIVRLIPKGDHDAGASTSHSSTFDHRRRPATFFTAMATAFR